ncbi:MAG: ribbon-helix-helix domain-containing protein [Tetragenococcus halophilus]|nr:hypothetical protein [Tetragenococcus halophilus]MCO8296230.1 hypothetical protein [Tetragenococcus halophilus]MCO8298787.1 hypothetical protein [Tetragenococcus halophilus]MDN6258124.1 ribbon-helix-helix domain-containing protein [Tetragenococcus halophilus]GFK25267.1 hypothetical protein YA163_23300 [Tetragenococcus halophilus]
MSLNSFNKKKDEEMKENYQATLDGKTKRSSDDFLSKISRKESERKRSITFSITESQLKKMDKKALENGFKNRSEFLSSIIDAI